MKHKTEDTTDNIITGGRAMKDKVHEKLLSAIFTLLGSALLLGAGYAFMWCMSELILWLGI